MKLHLSGQELLALNNLLHAEVTQVTVSPDSVHLKRIYDNVRACLISAMKPEQLPDVADAWLKTQQLKVNSLVEQNKSLSPASFLQLDEPDSVADRDYPRKHPPVPHMPKPGKKRRR